MKRLFRRRSELAATRVDSIELIILLLFRAAFAAAAVFALWQANYETAGIVLLGLVLSFLPQIVERNFKVGVPIAYEFIVVLFIFASIYMGEVNKAYEHFWWWDIVLHTSSGVLLGYIGFLILYVLYRKRQLKASAGLIAFFTFCVGMASAGIWEIFEFSVDQLFGGTMQHGLLDTMSDTVVACIGSIIAAGAAYWHIKHPAKSPLRRTLEHFFALNPELEKSKTPSRPKKV